MSSQIIIRPRAEADLADAMSWYEAQQEGLGRTFLRAFEESFDQIRDMPRAAPEVSPGVRRSSIGRFPYGIFYRVEDDFISVIAVYHARRDPRGWQTRV